MARPVDLAKGSRFIILASVCIVVAALYFAQVVLIPLALALLFSFLLTPLVTRLERRGLGRVPAVVIVTGAAIGVVVVLGWIVTIQVLNLGKNLPKYRANIVRHVNDLRGSGGSLSDIGRNVGELAKELTKDPPASQPASTPATTQTTSLPADATQDTVLSQLVAQMRRWEDEREEDRARVKQEAAEAKVAAASVVRGTSPEAPIYTQDIPPERTPFQVLAANADVLTEPLGTAGIVIVFVIFMLLQREDLRDRLIRLIGKGQIHVTTTALDDAAKRISRYLLAMAIVNGTYGVAIAIGLWAIGFTLGQGVPFPSVVLWGLLCAVLRFIPYVGPWIAAAFPIALSFAVYENYTPFFATVGMFVVVELLSNNVMEPMLYGSSTGMSTLAILVAAVFWTWLWGTTGLLLSTPLTVCFVVMGKYVPQLQFLDILLGDEPVLDLPDRVYQRLLALDSEDAMDLAQEHLEETSLERTYDEVLLPALAMAEQDRHKGKLGEERETFITQAMRDMVEELGDAARAAEERRAAAATVAAAKGEPPSATGDGVPSPTKPSTPVEGLPGERSLLPQGCSINVVCLPARDDGDDIANAMLAQLLALRGYCAHAIPVAALASEMLDAVEARKAHIVVVSALPPGAVSYSRYLCKRLHGRYGNDVPMAVGLWTIKGDLKKAKERITCAADVQVSPTLTGMLDLIRQMAQPMIVRQAQGERSTNDETRITNQ